MLVLRSSFDIDQIRRQVTCIWSFLAVNRKNILVLILLLWIWIIHRILNYFYHGWDENLGLKKNMDNRIIYSGIGIFCLLYISFWGKMFLNFKFNNNYLPNQ